MRATAVRQGAQAAVESVRVAAYTVPTDEPESDGTAEWDSTTIVVVELRAGGKSGIGYTYAPAAAGQLVEEKLAEVVTGRDAFAIGETWAAMGSALRNAGRPGIGFCALSAVDLALWDVKARLLVSNPPYIAFGESYSLPASVRNWEPPTALLGGSDGLAATAAIVQGGVSLLKQRGLLALEVDERRASLVAEMTMANGYIDVGVVLDLTGRERFVFASRA